MKNNWSLSLEKVFYPKTKDEVLKAFRLTFALDDRKQHRDRIEYFRERKEHVRQAIVNADWLLCSLANALYLSIDPPGLSFETTEENNIVRLSFIGTTQIVSSYTWKIPNDKMKKIVRRLTKMKRTVNFLDDNVAITLFNGSFPEIFIAIILLLKRKELEVSTLFDGNMYLELNPTTSVEKT